MRLSLDVNANSTKKCIRKMVLVDVNRTDLNVDYLSEFNYKFPSLHPCLYYSVEVIVLGDTDSLALSK